MQSHWQSALVFIVWFSLSYGSLCCMVFLLLQYEYSILKPAILLYLQQKWILYERILYERIYSCIEKDKAVCRRRGLGYLFHALLPGSEAADI